VRLRCGLSRNYYGMIILGCGLYVLFCRSNSQSIGSHRRDAMQCNAFPLPPLLLAYSYVRPPGSIQGRASRTEASRSSFFPIHDAQRSRPTHYPPPSRSRIQQEGPSPAIIPRNENPHTHNPRERCGTIVVRQRKLW